MNCIHTEKSVYVSPGISSVSLYPKGFSWKPSRPAILQGQLRQVIHKSGAGQDDKPLIRLDKSDHDLTSQPHWNDAW